MNQINPLMLTRRQQHKLVNNIMLPLYLGLALLCQTPALAVQFDSIAMRNMNAYNKFDGLAQNAIVIKTRVTGTRYLDYIEYASGEIADDEDNSFFLSIGPAWRFNKHFARSGIAFLELGTSPTWINNNDFADKTLGGHFFFTTNVQLGMHFGYRRELTLSLRLQHISNGGFGSKNPGTDMAGIELSYIFGK